jgi:hypothetical protein
MVRWNDGYYFARCGRCRRDLVRTAYGGWHVPKGYRVVWQARPPEGARPIHASAELRQSAVRAADPRMELPIQAVLRQLKERQQALAAAPEPDPAAPEPEATVPEPEVMAPEPEVMAPAPEAIALEPEANAPEPAIASGPEAAEPHLPAPEPDVELVPGAEPEPALLDSLPVSPEPAAAETANTPSLDEQPDDAHQVSEEPLDEPETLLDPRDPTDQAPDPLEEPLQEFAEAVEDVGGEADAGLPDLPPEATTDDAIGSLAAEPEPFQAAEAVAEAVAVAVAGEPAAALDSAPHIPPADDFMEEDPDRDVWAADPLDFGEPAPAPPMPEPLARSPAMASPESIAAPEALAAPVPPVPAGLPLPPEPPAGPDEAPPPGDASPDAPSPLPAAGVRALARPVPVRKAGPVAVPRRAGSFPRRVALPLILSCGALLLLVELAGGGEDEVPPGSAPLPPATAPAAVQPSGAYVAARIMNCRSAPARQAGSVRKLARGEPVEIIAREGDWVSVSHRGRQCWAAARYLSTQQPL